MLKKLSTSLGVLPVSPPRWIKILSISIVLLIAFLALPSVSLADDSKNCTDVKIWNDKYVFAPTPFIDGKFKEINYKITVSDTDENQKYEVSADSNNWIDGDYITDWHTGTGIRDADGKIVSIVLGGKITSNFINQFTFGKHRLNVRRKLKDGSEVPYCSKDSEDTEALKYYIDPAPTPTPAYSCSLTIQSRNPDRNKITPNDPFNIFIKIFPDASKFSRASVELINLNTGSRKEIPARRSLENNDEYDEYVALADKQLEGTYTVNADFFEFFCDDQGNCGDYTTTMCSTGITICFEEGCGVPTPTPTPFPTPTDKPECRSCHPNRCDTPICHNCSICRPTPTPTSAFPEPKLEALCNRAHPDLRDKCILCVNRPTDNPPGEGGIWTAIGCLPTNYSKLISEKIFPIGLGLAGGIAFLYFIYGCFLILTSMGNAEKVQQGKQIIVSALSGLLFIIFSVFILKVIGVDILQLPEFK